MKRKFKFLAKSTAITMLSALLFAALPVTALAANTAESYGETATEAESNDNVAIAETESNGSLTVAETPVVGSAYNGVENAAESYGETAAEAESNDNVAIAETESNDNPAADEDSGTEGGAVDAPTNSGKTDSPTDEDAATDAGADTSNEDDKNVFSIIYGEIMKNVGDIFSTLAFISSLLIAIASKKGLLPALTRAVTGIEGALDKVKRSADETKAGMGEGYKEIAQKLSLFDESIEGYKRSLTSIEERLSGLQNDSSEREKFKIIMASQIDLLYDIFMSSSLPQYQKEAVGARVVKMREELARDE